MLLLQTSKVFQTNPKLRHNLVLQRRTDFATAMDRDSYGSAVRVSPTLMTSTLTDAPKS